MDSIIQADIFFFIASISVVVVSIAIIIVTIYLTRILGDVAAITKRIRDSAEGTLDAIDTAVEDVKQDGVVATIMGMIHREKKKHRK